MIGEFQHRICIRREDSVGPSSHSGSHVSDDSVEESDEIVHDEGVLDGLLERLDAEGIEAITVSLSRL